MIGFTTNKFTNGRTKDFSSICRTTIWRFTCSFELNLPAFTLRIYHFSCCGEGKKKRKKRNKNKRRKKKSRREKYRREGEKEKRKEKGMRKRRR
jgi:hypothetical protein